MIPVVLIHKGYSDYVQHSLRQAAVKNKVVMISDARPDTPGVEFVSLADCWDRCDSFQKTYTHLSTDTYEYGLFCFQRWIVLQNYMESAGLDLVFYIDSDVMLYCDVNQEWDKYKQYDMTLLHRTAAVSSFFTRRGLDNFVAFMTKTFGSQGAYEFEKISSHYHVRRKHNLGGGITDMAYFDFFHYHHHVGGGPGKVGEMMSIIGDTTYDHCINLPAQYFEMKDGRKNAIITDGFPYVYSTKLERPIRFNSLHFQGKHKVHMKDYLAT